VISRDLIRAALFPGPARHSPDETRLAFDAMLAAAARRLPPAGRVALDGCCFARPDQRRRARELAGATGARLLGVHLELPPADAARRLAARGPHPANDRDPALVARLAADFAPPDPGDLVIDATLAPADVWAILRRELAGPGRAG
jgi:predicted kinase